MGRAVRNNVDYFPFLCKEGPAMHVISQKYGNDGYATWVKILRELAVTDYHFIHLGNDAKKMHLAAKCLVNEEKLIEIVKDLVSLGEFNKQLWEENQVLYNEKFVANIHEAYRKRNNTCVDLKKLQEVLSDQGIRFMYKPLREEKQQPEKAQLTIETAGAPPLAVKESARDIFFRDLPNSSALEKISMATKIQVSVLLSVIPEFNKFARLEYPNFQEFCEHFKNWALKRQTVSGTTSNPSQGTSFLMPGKKQKRNG